MQQTWSATDPAPNYRRSSSVGGSAGGSLALPRSVSAGYIPEYYNNSGVAGGNNSPASRKVTPAGQHFQQYNWGWGTPQQPKLQNAQQQQLGGTTMGNLASRYHQNRLSQARGGSWSTAGASTNAPERYHRRRSTTSFSGTPSMSSDGRSSSSSSLQSMGGGGFRSTSPANSLPEDFGGAQSVVRRTAFADRNSAYAVLSSSSQGIHAGSSPALLSKPAIQHQHQPAHTSSNSVASDDSWRTSESTHSAHSTRADSLRSASSVLPMPQRASLILPSDRRRASDPQLRVPSAPTAGILKPPKEVMPPPSTAAQPHRRETAKLGPLITTSPAAGPQVRDTTTEVPTDRELPVAVSAAQRQPEAPAPLAYPGQPPLSAAPVRRGHSNTSSPSPSPSMPNFRSVSPIQRPASAPIGVVDRENQFNRSVVYPRADGGITAPLADEPTTLGARLKKAFTFKSRSSSSSGTIKSAGDDDTRSLFSMRSTASSASFATLKKFGRGTRNMFRKKKENDDDRSALDLATATPPTERKLAAPVATPVLTRTVAEAHMDAPLPRQHQQPPPLSPQKSDRQDDRAYESEAIPSLTSESSSAGDIEEVPDNLAAGDTVFPKNLDRLSVETIKSSIERTKSLERRRSRRSVKSKEEAAEEELPAKTEVYVHVPPATDIQRSNSVSSVGGTPRSILKSPHADGNEDSGPAAATNGEDDEDDDSNSITGENYFTVKSSDASEIPKANLPPVGTPLLNVEFSDSLGLNFDVLGFGIEESFSGTGDSVTTATTSTDLQSASFSTSTTQSQPNNLVAAPSNQDENGTPVSNVDLPESAADASTSLSAAQSDDSSITTRASLPLRYNHTRSPSSATSSLGAPSPAMSTPTLEITAAPNKMPRKSRTNSVTFSSRIVIYDTWGRADYDRRPDLATCNKLTPLLAQQIKEELNNFKMEMEIHTESKAFTHFF